MSGRALLLLAPALAALATGCGESLDTDKGEQVIKQDIVQKTGAKAVAVNCPDDVDKKKDENFSCTATVDGQKVDVPVVQVDDDGRVSYDPRMVDTKDAAKQAEELANERTENTSGAKAQCPTVVPLKQGAIFSCDVQTPGPNFKAEVTQTNGKGGFRVKLAAP